MCMVFWAKAGLAGDWILDLISYLILLITPLGLMNFNRKSRLLLFISPFLISTFVMLVSYFNPSYKILNEDDWKSLGIAEKLSKEVNLEKITMVSETIRYIKYVEKKDPLLAITLIYDLKNRFLDKFNNKGPTYKLIIDYENLINLKNNLFLPSITIKSKSILKDYFHFIMQIISGLVLFLFVKDKRTIRNILYILTVNAGILSFCGIVQQNHYVPSDNLNEIWGIWDTPEPRYYFASFTYKNHWSAFALIYIIISIALIANNIQRKSHKGLVSFKSISLIMTVLLLSISIPLWGSKSGTLLLIMMSFIIVLLILKYINKLNIKIFLLSIIYTSVTIFYIIYY